MGRKIYISAGASRGTKSAYIGLSGASRHVKRVYIGRNEVSSMCYPERLYMWAVYTIKETPTYSELESDRIYVDCSPLYMRSNATYAKTYEFDESRGLYHIGATYKHLGNVSSGSEIYCTSFKDYAVCRSGEYSEIYKMVYRHTYREMSLSGNLYSTKASMVQSCGDLITTIIADVRDAYPDNGVFDQRWYVYKGEI